MGVAKGHQVIRLQEIRELARIRGIKAGKMNNADLIRAVQKEEGNSDCYTTHLVEKCNQVDL